MRETLLKNGRVQLYMDSLELSTYANGGQLWGYDFMDEFKSRRGYDLAPHLPLVFKQKSMMMTAATPYVYVCQDETFFKKLINDLYQTMTDMYMENVLSPIQTWLHGVGMTLRAEISYGLPFEISEPGKYVDGIETESLEFASQIDSYRGMAWRSPYLSPAVLLRNRRAAGGKLRQKSGFLYPDHLYPVRRRRGPHRAPRLFLHLRPGYPRPRVARPGGHAAHLLRTLRLPPAGLPQLQRLEQHGGPLSVPAAPGQAPHGSGHSAPGLHL